MIPLKEAFINKSNLHKVSISTTGWKDALGISIDDLKEGNILLVRNGNLYVYCPVKVASPLFTSNIDEEYDYVLVREDDTKLLYSYCYMELSSFIHFPKNKYSKDRDIVKIYPKEKHFKNTKELKAYINEIDNIV